ncbi:aspartate/glutamate racemase family protein [Gallibacterium anatis]|uniref:aspartate/glutamate racemase family protein n=1 Tax=Gallibacterium anatis TaxID=750 RepID=UPI00053174C3|nr:aspartate/glutamate racemase family protein [Gallibacterium anatis]KGQ23208.1 aspartate racemase [Gallibacterium anatis]KGQ26603.1 aspartate racemase [Gallibacterium anatis]
MKTIGLLGGMSWESTVTYYQLINQTVKQQLGGLHSAKIILYSVDFDEIEKCQAQGDWDKSAEILASAAQKLVLAGADFVVICTNTMHKVAPQIAKAIDVPLIHIADATISSLKQQHIRRVALLGTKYTMLEDFYKARIIEQGIEVLIPNAEQLELINQVIFDELCLGQINPSSRAKFQQIIDSLKQQSAEGVILGCTEIGLLISQQDSVLPIFDTTVIHAHTAAKLALEQN